MWIFAEVPWGGGVKRQYVVDNGNFQHFCGYFFGNFRDEASVIKHQYVVRRQLFRDPKIYDLE